MSIKDLPDYQKKVVVVTVPGVYPAEMRVDHRKILGVALKTPYVAASIPSSIENPALAYNSVNDLFKVRIDQWNITSIDANVTDRWARQLGQTDLARVLGAALSHANPVICRLTSGSAFIDPRDRNWNLGSSDVPDIMDRAARLLGKVYGSQDVLQQRATTKELIVQIQHQGAEKDPTQIRALTSSDIVTVNNLLNPHPITQTTRTNLKVQPEREDLSPVSVDVALGAAGDSEILAAVSGQKHKVYAFGYESDADVQVGLRFGTSANKFGRRITAGVYAQTLVHPLVGPVNTALNFRGEGTVNAKVWVQYITEA